MAKDCLESLENNLVLTKKTQELRERREQDIFFCTNQIVYYLETAIDKFREGKETSFECSKIEENVQFLSEGLDSNWKQNQEFYYHKILHTAFATKRTLSEICFGRLLNGEDKLTKEETNKLQAHLLIMQNNSKKLKGLVGSLVA